MPTTTIDLTPIPPFDLHVAVTGHGWYQLAPFYYEETKRTLSWPQRLNDGAIVYVSLSGSRAGEPKPCLRAEVESPEALDGPQRKALAETVAWISDADADLQPFYTRVADNPGYAKAVANAEGRFLRSPSLFEDFVKVICTTNTTWNQTKGMVSALIEHWGEGTDDAQNSACFPTASALAAASEDDLRRQGRLGYRAPYVLELARRSVDGDLNLDAFRQADIPTTDLRRDLIGIKGIGPYAAASLLTLLGHYDHLAVDSWTRKLVIPCFFPGRDDVSDAEIVAFYQRWHPYQQLAYWLYDWESDPA